MDCELTIENLANTKQKIRFNLAGPGGVNREGFRSDMRSVVAGFRDSKGHIISKMINMRSLVKAKSIEDVQLTKPGGNFLWAAAVNKYFAAIAVPLPEGNKDYCDWITSRTGQAYNPDGDSKSNSGDETVGVNLGIASNTLAASNQENNSKTYKFQLYFGPKDKSLFDKNELYRKLGFAHTISFMGCCCPKGIIKPLAFGILAIMKWMYIVIPNYGVVIIILVFLMRLIMHPITKKSQVSMSKMSTLAPKVEEIKKKYANNKTEMNKQMMALYREQGASPMMGMLPMMVQMPIWIALWSAVYTSIDLRGAAFLPFWITDLSAPDAAWTFPRVLTVPLLGSKIASLNLLPILMGVAFYLQQRLMPSQSNATTNPQVAQQQKMMKIMLPVLFPLMLYNGPAGVNLYIMASTFAGVVEQYVIRKHIREKEEAESKGLVAATSKTGGKAKKKKPKPFYKT
jgi:YidC/Oxa1 family membrane protein insertase